MRPLPDGYQLSSLNPIDICNPGTFCEKRAWNPTGKHGEKYLHEAPVRDSSEFLPGAFAYIGKYQRYIYTTKVSETKIIKFSGEYILSLRSNKIDGAIMKEEKTKQAQFGRGK